MNDASFAKCCKAMAIAMVVLCLVAVLMFLWVNNNVVRHALSSQSLAGTTSISSDSNSLKVTLQVTNGSAKSSNVKNVEQEYVLGLFNWYKANNAPIEFYGKIIDQDMRGVPAVQIRVRISMLVESLAYQMAKKDTHEPLDNKELILTSDEEGRFSIRGIKGQIVYIEAIEKMGYEISGRELKRFCYGNHTGDIHVPDSNKPVLFRVWAKRGAEPLIRNNASARLMPNDEKVYLSLLNEKSRNKMVVVDDLCFQMWVDTNTCKHPNWSCTVEAISGGVIESSDGYLYAAPKDGYTRQLRWNYTTNSPDYRLRTSKKIYVKSRGGKMFAGVELEIDCRAQFGGYVFLDNSINPYGSRNLEYDRDKVVRGDEYLKVINELNNSVPSSNLKSTERVNMP